MRLTGMKTVSRPPRSMALAGIALLSTMVFAACSVGGSVDSGGSLSPAADEGAGSDGALASSDEKVAPTGDRPAAARQGGAVSEVDLVSTATPAVIKVGAVILESDDVGDVVARVEALAASVGGGISNEETYTDTDGRQSRSRLSLQVPVDTFEDSLDSVATLGDLVSKTSSDEDVTAKIADVDSRVRSAEESIEQIRRLFSQARKLGDIITLERELSSREADLEALQAQQRVLAAKTTMSTITINVSLPDEEQSPTDTDQAGFIAGIQRGWDGLVTFVIGAAHALGLVLPLGTLALALALTGWIAVRRLTPRRATPASE